MRCWSTAIAICWLGVAARPAAAVSETTELASATMGAPGAVAGQAIRHDQFLAWRFEMAGGLRVTEVGGHMLRAPDGGVFAAIVKLDAIDAMPPAPPFDDAKLLGTAALTPPSPSAEIFAPLSATLTPGSYALVFGAGLYGGGTTKTGTNAAMAQSAGQTLLEGTTAESFVAWFGGDQEWRAGFASNMRFVVRGQSFAGPADFELDGDFDGGDLAIWRHGFGMPANAEIGDGDADSDGTVDGGDFLAWQRSLAPASTTATAAVAEPAAVGLAMLSAVGAAADNVLRKRRNRSRPRIADGPLAHGPSAVLGIHR